jgi:predicted RNA-binding protein YlqC (UPF0109 family)
MKDLLEFIVKSLVDKPEEVKVEEEKAEDFVNLRLTVAPEDMGKVIGKQGKVIKAIRTIVRIPAIKANMRVNVELTEAGDRV